MTEVELLTELLDRAEQALEVFRFGLGALFGGLCGVAVTAELSKLLRGF